MRTPTLLLLAALALPAHAWDLGGLGDFRFEPVADDVYVMHGPLGEPSPENQGFMNNPAILVTPEGVIMIDPGGTYPVGRQVLAEMRKVTDRPVVAVLNTHIHGDHWLANQAVKEAYPEAVVYAHPKMIAQAGEQGLNWVDMMDRLTGGRSRGTRVQAPERATRDGDLLEIAGQHLRIYAGGPAHTDTDIMIEHLESGTLFTGDNSFNARMGRFDGSASIHGNIEALRRALAAGARVYVPGHGRSGPAELAVIPFLTYLERLAGAVQAGYDEELQDFEIKPAILARFAEYRDWEGFERQFGRHVNKMYLEIEARDL